MKKIGIVGGMAPQSTLEFYRQLTVLAQENLPDRTYATVYYPDLHPSRVRLFTNISNNPH